MTAPFPSSPPSRNIAPGIISVGVELEGEIGDDDYEAIEDWAERHCERMSDNGEGALIHEDGTVDTPHGGYPGELTFWSTSLPELNRWLRTMYRQFNVRPNRSCGFHVHIKPVSSLVKTFATKRYWDGFTQAYRRFSKTRSPKYAARIHNSWCAIRTWRYDIVHDAMDGYGGDRYTAINLCSLKEQGTVEHRILPYQATPEEAIRSLKWMVETVSHLVTAQGRTRRSASSYRSRTSRKLRK